MTQWLIEEAAYVALELDDVQLRREASEEQRAEDLLFERHAELTAKAAELRGRA